MIEVCFDVPMYTRSVAFRVASGRRKLGRRGEAEARVADEALLKSRLGRLGVRRPVVVHENQTVMVSVGRSGQLRIHRGYAYSSDCTLRAIIKFINAKNRSARKIAEREVMSFSIDSYLQPRSKRSVRGQSGRDAAAVRELKRLHDQLNAEFFQGTLSKVPFRVSYRMRTRLGEVTVDPRGERVVEITISRRHWDRDGLPEVRKTLLHEMIHQWQVESGLEANHGVQFREKALELGVPPAARRAVGQEN